MCAIIPFCPLIFLPSFVVVVLQAGHTFVLSVAWLPVLSVPSELLPSRFTFRWWVAVFGGSSGALVFTTFKLLVLGTTAHMAGESLFVVELATCFGSDCPASRAG